MTVKLKNLSKNTIKPKIYLGPFLLNVPLPYFRSVSVMQSTRSSEYVQGYILTSVPFYVCVYQNFATISDKYKLKLENEYRKELRDNKTVLIQLQNTLFCMQLV